MCYLYSVSQKYFILAANKLNLHKTSKRIISKLHVFHTRKILINIFTKEKSQIYHMKYNDTQKVERIMQGKYYTHNRKKRLILM